MDLWEHRSSPSPPPKRLKSGSCKAIKFATSPQKIDAKQAVALKQQDPNCTSLHLTSTKELSLQQCKDLENVQPGFALSVWPSPTGETNKLYKELLKFKEDYYLYTHLLQSSFVTCVGDAISFVMAMLDHSLWQLARSQDFKANFIGPYATKPFQSDKAQQITYIILLKFIAYLQKQMENSKQDKSEQVESNKQDKSEQSEDNAFLARCIRLRDDTEISLISMMELFGVQVANQKTFAEGLRNDIIVYRQLGMLYGKPDLHNEASELHLRNMAAHPFTMLMWTQFNKDIANLDGLDSHFPQVQKKVFKDRSSMAQILGRVALLVVDLQNKFEEGTFGEDYKTVLPTAFFLIRQFMKENNYYKRAVEWHDKSAMIPGKHEPIEPPLKIGGMPPSLHSEGSKLSQDQAIFPSF